MPKRLGTLALALLLIVSPFVTSAQTLDELQAKLQRLIAELAALRAESTGSSISTTPSTPANSNASAAATSNPAAACLTLTRNLSLDSEDATTDGEVTKLQRYLAQFPDLYPEGRITGFFGPATLRAVQRWQAKYGIVSSGDPDSTGYGYVGPKTRAALREKCATPSTSSTESTATKSTPSVQSYAQATYVVATTTSSASNYAQASYAAATGPLITSFVSNPSKMPFNGEVTLTWTSVRTKSCTLYSQDLDGNLIAVANNLPTNGSYVVTHEAARGKAKIPPELPVSLALQCIDVQGKIAPGGLTLYLSGVPAGYSSSPPPNPYKTIQPNDQFAVKTLSASPSEMPKGGSVDLTWTSVGAASCNIYVHRTYSEVGAKELVASNVSPNGTYSMTYDRSAYLSGQYGNPIQIFTYLLECIRSGNEATYKVISVYVAKTVTATSSPSYAQSSYAPTYSQATYTPAYAQGTYAPTQGAGYSQSYYQSFYDVWDGGDGDGDGDGGASLPQSSNVANAASISSTLQQLASVLQALLSMLDR